MTNRILGLLGVLLVSVIAYFVYVSDRSSSGSPDPVAAEASERRPSEWGWLQRTYPHFQADADAYRVALLQAQTLKQVAGKRRAAPWVFAGPTNIGGRISDVAFDPQEPNTVYAGAATGGVFKSIDRGVTWGPIFDDQAVLTVGDIAVDPVNPETIYVGTGEANGGHNNFAGGGVYKSIDGGTTWQFMGLEATVSIGRIRVHPTNPERVYVAAVGSYFGPHPERGLYRSDDGGATWDNVLFVNDTTGVIDVVMRPDDPDVLLAATWQRSRTVNGAELYGPGSGVYRSTDGGDTWERLGAQQGLPDPSVQTDSLPPPRVGRIGLALCRDQPDVMYALYNDGFSHLGLYRTDDGGDAWYRVDPNNQLPEGMSNFSWYFGQVRVHPENPDWVYVMDVWFMRSFNGGQSWTRQTGTHVDHHALAFAPDNPDVLVNGNDGGIALSENNGSSWTRVDELPVTQFYEIAYDPSLPERFYGGTQDNGVWRTTTGALDDWEQLMVGDGFYVIVDPDDSETIYMETQFGNLVRQTPGQFGLQQVPALTGINLSEKRNWSTPVVLDPNDSSVLYYGTNRVYRSVNKAGSWSPISGDLTKQSGTSLLGSITAIAVAPANSDVLFAGTDDGNVWVTEDYGVAWSNVTEGLPNRWVTRIAVDPLDDRIAYVTFSGLKWRSPQPHVFRTVDRGATWEDISSNLPDAPVNAFAIDPLRPDELYLGSDIGAFASYNAGGSWEPLDEGMPAVPVNDLKINPHTRVLIAGTHGRSMYTLQLDRLATSIDDLPDEAAPFSMEAVFPNPFTTVAHVSVQLDRAAPVRVAVYDALGRNVRTLHDGVLPAGIQRVTWDGNDASGRRVAAGTYFVRAAGGDSARPVEQSRSLTLVR